MYALFSNQLLNLDFSTTNITCSNSDTVGSITSVDDNNKYKFSFTPSTAGANNKLQINNAKDVNNFVYPLFQSIDLTFNAGPVTYGFTKVRFIKGPYWIETSSQQDDNLQGSLTWGNANDDTSSWSVIFDSAVPGWTEMLIITKEKVDLSTWKGSGVVGEKWIMFNRITAQDVTSGNVIRTINSSWNSTTPYQANWQMRANITSDPFIWSSEDGQSLNAVESGDAYYGEHPSAGGQYNALLVNGGGMYIYIK